MPGRTAISPSVAALTLALVCGHAVRYATAKRMVPTNVVHEGLGVDNSGAGEVQSLSEVKNTYLPSVSTSQGLGVDNSSAHGVQNLSEVANTHLPSANTAQGNETWEHHELKVMLPNVPDDLINDLDQALGGADGTEVGVAVEDVSVHVNDNRIDKTSPAPAPVDKENQVCCCKDIQVKELMIASPGRLQCTGGNFTATDQGIDFTYYGGNFGRFSRMPTMWREEHISWREMADKSAVAKCEGSTPLGGVVALSVMEEYFANKQAMRCWLVVRNCKWKRFQSCSNSFLGVWWTTRYQSHMDACEGDDDWPVLSMNGHGLSFSSRVCKER